MRLVGIAVFGLATSLVISSEAAMADAVTDQLKSCRAINDVVARAACYDRIVDRLSPAPAQPVAPTAARSQPVAPPSASQPQVPPPAAKTPTDRFGESDLALERRVPEAELPPDVLVATVTAARTDGAGYGTFTLDNGQTWRQTEGSTLRISKGARVKIKGGVMGAFYLSLENANKSFRVRRVN